ncbi:MAG: hypothetical protein HRU40_06355 [Saprospiraceae bacterium]|nr:hypothetical protein [Saprospiraceae bacterium]
MNSEFRQIWIIYGALAMGQIVLALVVVYWVTSEGAAEASEIPSLDYIVPLSLIGAVFTAYTINKMLAEKASQRKGLSAKLAHYKNRVIIRSALIEGANLLILISAMLTGKMNFLLFFLLGFGMFILFYPRMSVFSQEYALTPDELKSLDPKI